MGQKKDIEKTKPIVNKYDGLIDYDMTNKMIQSVADSDFDFSISKKTLQNVSKWALNGLSSREIADNLELTQKQFKTLCSICPTLIYVMQESSALADIVVSGSLFQTAIGGQIIRKQQLVKVGDYQDGVRVGEHYEKMWIEEELPPNALLLKYIAEHKLSEKFGDKASGDNSQEYKSILANMTDDELKAIDVAMKQGIKDEK